MSDVAGTGLISEQRQTGDPGWGRDGNAKSEQLQEPIWRREDGGHLGAVLSASTPYASSPALAKVKVESGLGAIHL